MICDYLASNEAFFRDAIPGGEEALRRHIDKMRRPGIWATTLEVTAASHLLLRPIHLITDEPVEAYGITKIEPPACIAAESWGPTIYLAHFLQLHFEGTRHVLPPDFQRPSPLDASAASSASGVAVAAQIPSTVPSRVAEQDVVLGPAADLDEDSTSSSSSSSSSES